MKCPYCNSPETKVVDKRATENESVTRRRRECLACQKRFTTYERVEQANIIVMKKDGRREPFDRNKVERGIVKACEKRPVSYDQIKMVVSDIETTLRNEGSVEVSSKLVGDLIMKKLKTLDTVAYIRFASVYKEFKDIDSFQKEIERIAKKGGEQK